MEWAGLGWGGPPEEALVFTLGGSLDFAYLRSTELRPQVYLVGRGGDLECDLLHQLGASVELLSTDDPVVGWKWVTDELDEGRPVMVWADIAALPYLRVRLQMSRHDIVIVGYDDDQRLAYVVDNDRKDVQAVPYDDLARARASTSFPVPTRHTTYVVNWPDRVPDLGALAAWALMTASSKLCRGDGRTVFGDSPAAVQGTGLAGVRLFADDLNRWPDVLGEDDLHRSLSGLSAFVEKAGTGGGFFRKLQGSGCQVLAEHLGDPSVQNAAEAAYRASRAWSAMASAASNRGMALSRRAAVAAELAAVLPDIEADLAAALATGARALGGEGVLHHRRACTPASGATAGSRPAPLPAGSPGHRRPGQGQLPQRGVIHLGVAGCRGQVSLTKQLGDLGQPDTSIEQVGRQRVTQAMGLASAPPPPGCTDATPSG